MMLVSMLVGSNNYGINLGFMLTFLLAGLGLSAMIQTWRNLADLDITAGRSDPVYCGDNAVFHLDCHNSRTTSRAALQISCGGSKELIDIPPGESARVACSLPTTKRGYCDPGRFRLETWFPLGMFRAWAWFSTGQKCLVYPRPAPADIALDDLFDTPVPLTREQDDNTDFAGHRKYRPGDNIKRIDWKAHARGRGDLVKQYVSDDDEEIWIRWNDARGNDTEEKLSIMCRAVIELSSRNRRYGMELPGHKLDPDNGSAHRRDCMTVLALFQTD